MRIILVLLVAVWYQNSYSQECTIKGTITDISNNNPIAYATVQILNTKIGTNSSESGDFEINGLTPGVYSLKISFLGYKELVLSEIAVSNIKPFEVFIQLEAASENLTEIVIKSSPFKTKEESPISLRSIGVTEIARSPGSNRDISKVVKALPGVTRTVSFRNDLIIRGGAPNENRFYVDEVEVPNINHFATQGSTGGPVGMINVTFLREVDFYSGAFPASKGNALSSIFDFKMRNGRSDHLGGTLTVGSSDVGLTLEGPIKEKTTYIASARRSYLQFLFKALELPFLPTYNDFQLKIKHSFNQKNELSFIGLGAIDDFKLNTEANNTETQQYILNYLPISTQWNYTNGLVYKHYQKNGYWTTVLSRNMLNNEAKKYAGNDDTKSENLILSYKSKEIENKIRTEYNFKSNKYSVHFGLGLENSKYSNKTFNKIATSSGVQLVNYQTDLDFYKYYLFVQYHRKIFNEKWSISAGLRNDGNSYSAKMQNLLLQTSPRFALSYQLNSTLSIHLTEGIYYQLPAYTTLGYKENGILINKQNNLKYIQAIHNTAGLIYQTKTEGRLSVEFYLKNYSNYPLLLRDSITLANLGGDFGVVGTEPAISFAKGISYGLECMYQQKLYKGFYGIIAYTFGNSEFENKNKIFLPSSWDSKHIINLSLGRQFKKSWEIGINWRYQSGLPYTPFDDNSNLKTNWDINGKGLFNYDQINSLRYEGISQLDFRVDKKWFFKTWNLELYLDIENVFGNSIASKALILDRPMDSNNKPIGDAVLINPSDPLELQRYKLKYINDASGNTLPSIGITLEW
ncbi:MAG: TonB-dependent receptor [Saprospiraceae bacterium]